MIGPGLPLIIDTDPGVDDAVALLLASASPEVELRAVTSVYGNVPLGITTANAGRILALTGRSDVPFAAGADRPLVHPQPERAEAWHGDDGLGGRAAALPAGAAPDPRGAVGLMAEVLRTSEVPVTIAAIGPLTNIALLLAVHPGLAPRIGRIVVMGGSFGAGNTAGAGEFNIHCDPEAAHRVLTQAEVAVTLVPLDLTMRCLATRAWLDTLATAGPRCAELASVITPCRAAFRRHYGIDAVALHDAVAVLGVIVPDALRTTPMPVRVACDLGPARGVTVPMLDPASGSSAPMLDPASGTSVLERSARTSGPLVQVALDADTDAVLTAVLERLRRLG